MFDKQDLPKYLHFMYMLFSEFPLLGPLTKQMLGITFPRQTTICPLAFVIIHGFWLGTFLYWKGVDPDYKQFGCKGLFLPSGKRLAHTLLLTFPHTQGNCFPCWLVVVLFAPSTAAHLTSTAFVSWDSFQLVQTDFTLPDPASFLFFPFVFVLCDCLHWEYNFLYPHNTYLHFVWFLSQ